MLVRKRPIFDHETTKGEYDVLMVKPENRNHAATRISVFNCLMHPDLKRMFIETKRYPFDGVFGETANNDDVYSALRPAIQAVVAGGQHAILLMYGATGKTVFFLMSGGWRPTR